MTESPSSTSSDRQATGTDHLNRKNEDEDDGSSPISPSLLRLNSIRTRSMPVPSTSISPLGTSNSYGGHTKEPNEKKDGGPGRKKFIVPDHNLTLEIPEKEDPWNQSKPMKHPSILKIGPENHAAFVKEMQSPRFQAILRLTSRRHRNIKSFSHELNSKGVCPFPFPKLRAFGHTEEVMVMIRAKFDKLKEEVNNDLGIFAGELVSLIEKSDCNSKWREGVEDLLLIARRCAKMSSTEFWMKCEDIVLNLDDRRQELTMGPLKRAHTRLLFILTRCTRLVQFHKESGYEDGHMFYLHQSSDLGAYREKARGAEDQDSSDPLDSQDMNDKSRKKSHGQAHSLTLKHNRLSRLDVNEVGTARSSDSPSSGYRMSSWKKLPSPSKKPQKRGSAAASSPLKHCADSFEHNKDISGESPASLVGNSDPSSKLQSASFGAWGGHQHQNYDNLIICRICEVEIPMVFLEEHSRICTIADRCDLKGLSVNERLERVCNTLEKILESWNTKAADNAGSIPGSSTADETEEFSPKRSSLVRRDSEDMLDCACGTVSFLLSDNVNISPNANKISSTPGSLTPRSPLTPRANQIKLLLTKKKMISEHEDHQQIKKLLDIARSVASVNNSNYSALEYMIERLEDLKYSIHDRKVDALVVETFGKRIEKLLQEKYVQLCGQIDDEILDTSQTINHEDDSTEEETLRSVRSSPINQNTTKDRTSIEDFEIIKPISRGAFGRVFLARKRATGDLFAIKVLRKADMIRKNAVESILAERDILITARNPFVVRFFYSFTCKENLYLVMEYLNGGDLYSLLRNLGCLDEDMARIYMAEVVLALEYMHSVNVIHRDLKPDNLLIGPDGHIKLTDFGLSKVGLINSTDDLSGPSVGNAAFLSDENSDTKTKQSSRREQRQKHSVVGTPDYLAPEILLGMGHGATADWWSVGVILFELLVGIPPFNADHPQQIFDNIMNRDIPWPKVPEEMSYEAYDLINKLLTETPVQRLGATGAGEVKQHAFFKDINWDTLARQKAMFIPLTEGAYDTSYFMTRYIWNPEEEHVKGASDFDEMTESGSDSCSSDTFSHVADEERDECGSLADFGGPNLTVKYSFSNFSFKNLSQLASINYDLVVRNAKEVQDGVEPSGQ